MHNRWPCATPWWATVAATVLLTVPASAQSGVNILRYTPADTGTPGNLISVTFDRPVAGMLGRSFDARQVMSLEPAIDGTVGWRDPSTVRFVPAAPFAPGTSVVVSIDTAAAASAGTRRGPPRRITVRFPGPTPLARSISTARFPGGGELGPFPTFQVLYSAPVDLDAVSRDSRIVYTGACAGKTTRLRALRQRPVVRGEGYEFEVAGGFDRDTVGDRFRRVVEMQPVDSIPPGCAGTWEVVSFDPARPASTWRYPVRSYPEFSITGVDPWLSPRWMDPDGLRIRFSAPVRRADVMRYMRVTPAITRTEDELALFLPDGPIVDITIPARLRSRQAYTVSLDTAMRDIFGRRLAVRSVTTVPAHDRVPGIRQQLGLVTIPAASPSVRVRVVNVDTLRMLVTAIPESLVAPVMSTQDFRRLELMQRLWPAVTDSQVVRVPVRGTHNVEHDVDIPLPAAFRGRSGFFAIRFAVAARSVAPDSLRAERSRVPADVEMGNRDSVGYDLGFVAQVSPLVAHAKIGGERGGVFVTGARGEPMAGASIRLMGATRSPAGSARPLLLATGRTGVDGLAMMTPTGTVPAPPPGRAGGAGRGAVDRDPSLESLRYLEITAGNDRLVMPVQYSMTTPALTSLDPYRFGTWSVSPARLHGTVLADRNLYRPGEMLFAKAYARTGLLGEARTPAGDSVLLVLANARDTLWRAAATFNAFGAVADSVRIPATAAPGAYVLSMSMLSAGLWQPWATSLVRVEEFRPPEFVVALTTDSVRRFVGDTVPVRLHADYLFGAPMSGATVRWSAQISPASAALLGVKAPPGFLVGRTHTQDAGFVRPPGFVSLNGVDSLDRTGNLTLRVPTTGALRTHPASVSISAAIVDANNQTVTSTTRANLASSTLYIAAKGHVENRPAPLQPQTFDVIAVRADGDRVPGVAVRATVIRWQWGRDTLPEVPSTGYRWVPDTISRATVRTAAEPVPVRFTPATEGVFELLLQAEDERDGLTETNVATWVYRGARPGTYTLKLDVTPRRDPALPYAVGDTAVFTFESPFAAADAWITIEREGLIEQRRTSAAAGTNTIRVPVAKKFAPSVWVGVTLIRRTATPIVRADSLAESVRAGYAMLALDSTANGLRVEVASAAPTWKPGDTSQVSVRVSELAAAGRGRPVRAEVAIWAVDDGVLSMTGYGTPDVLRALAGRLGVGQPTRTSLAFLPWRTPSAVTPGVNVRALLIPGDDRGGAAGGGRGGGGAAALPRADAAQVAQFSMRASPEAIDAVGQDVVILEEDFAVAGKAAQAAKGEQQDLAARSDFRLTAFFVGSAVTDDSGRAVIRARLPDNITTFRLMATAVTTGERYGSGEARLVATKRVVARAALPRFLRYGDSVLASVLVNLRERNAAALRVVARVSGATMTGDSTASVSVTDTRGATARFPIAVPERSTADVTRVIFEASDAADGDAVATVLPLRPVGSPRVHTVVGALRDTTTVVIELPGDVDPGRSRFTVSFGTSPVVAMRTAYERLRAYPYYCTDAIISRARALLTLVRAERVTGERLVTRDSTAVLDDLQRAADEIVRRQQPTGQIAFWPGAPIVWYELTADAGSFLLSAREEGVRVPQHVFDRLRALFTGRTWIVDTVYGAPWERRARLRAYLGARVGAATFLRELGAPDTTSERMLLARQADLAWEDRVALASLVASSPGGGADARAMLTEAWRAAQVIGSRIELADSLRGAGPFPSRIRPAARLFTLTSRLVPDHPLLGALAETIMQQGRAETTWAWNTQDYAAAIAALSQLVSGQRVASGSRVDLRDAAGRVVLSRTVGAAQTDSSASLVGLLSAVSADSQRFAIRLSRSGASAADAPLYFTVSVVETSRARPVTPDIKGIAVERWYERFTDGTPVIEVDEGELVRVRLRVTVPVDRQFVAIEDLLPAGLEVVDLTMRTSGALGPFAAPGTTPVRPTSSGPTLQGVVYGKWDGGWWVPWEYTETRDDRVVYHARQLWAGSYDISYLTRATTPGRFVRPPAHAEEMYNPAAQGRSEGGVFVVRAVPK